MSRSIVVDDQLPSPPTKVWRTLTASGPFDPFASMGGGWRGKAVELAELAGSLP